MSVKPKLLKPITSFSVRRLKPSKDTKLLEKSALLYEGRELNCMIDGYELEKQFETDNYYLLFTNYDCPFEETCTITLVNKQLTPVATRTIGIPYLSLWLTSVEVLDSDEFLIRFDEVQYRLRVNYSGTFRWRFFARFAMRLSRLPDHT